MSRNYDQTKLPMPSPPIRRYDFSQLDGGPAASRAVKIRYSRSLEGHYNVMVHSLNGFSVRVFGPVPDLVEAKQARDEIRQIIDTTRMIQGLPAVRRKDQE